MSFQTFLKFVQEETSNVIVSKSHLLKSNSFIYKSDFRYEFVSNHFISGLPKAIAEKNKINLNKSFSSSFPYTY